MKLGCIAKSFLTGLSPEDEIAEINKFTQRNLAGNEIFSFPLVLCSNEIDRDNEQFTLESLGQLAKLFVGKTGISDHNPKCENQVSRIFWTEVRPVDGKMNLVGEQLYHLYAKAYMVRSEKNSDLILDIEAGIKGEVSVGCAVESVTCSICGENLKTKQCQHISGATYDGKPCYRVLAKAIDAYEWSFVVVPAQRQSGVIKNFNKEDDSMIFTDEQIGEIKSLINGGKRAVIEKSADGYCVNEMLDVASAEDFLTAERVKSAVGIALTADAIASALKAVHAAGIDLLDVESGLTKQAHSVDEEIQSRASAYDKLKASALDSALKNGVRAKGDKFDESRWKKLMKNFTIEEIGAQSAEWDHECRDQFHAGKRFSANGTFADAPIGNLDQYKI